MSSWCIKYVKCLVQRLFGKLSSNDSNYHGYFVCEDSAFKETQIIILNVCCDGQGQQNQIRQAA